MAILASTATWVPDRTLDLVAFQCDQVKRRVGQRPGEFGVMRCILVGAVQKRVRQLFETLEAQERAAQHQQRRNRPRRQRADGQRGGHQNQLVFE